MAEKKLRPGQKIKMVSVDELLGCAGEESSLEIDINRIQPFQNHPFKVVDDAKMDDLVNSIRQNGVLTPVLVRPTDDGGYEMISGHRRMHAAERAGLATIPAIIRELTDDDATIVMVEANSQREEILPSEKAFAYKMRYEAIRRSTGRKSKADYDVEKNVSQLGTQKRSDKVLEEEFGESRNQIHRFIRLTELIPELLEMVDTKKMPLVTEVDISYIDQKVQQYLYEYIKENGMVKSYQVTALRKYLEDYESISQSKMITVLNEMITGKTQSKSVHFTEKKLRKYFSSNYTVNDMEKIMIRLLEKWKSEQEGGNNGI